MKNIRTRGMLLSLAIALFSSCQNENIPDAFTKGTHEPEQYYIEFSQTVAKAVKDKDIRDFIKQQASLRIDNDYDVIYHYVKDIMMNNGKTFRENLAKYYHNENIESFDKIANSDMTLTILVPYIKNIISVDSWDTENTIPIVAYRDENSNVLPAFNAQGEVPSLERYSKPKEAVLVIKSNERLTINTNSVTRSLDIDANSISNDEGIFGYFIDSEFNNIKEYNQSSSSHPKTRTTNSTSQPEVFLNFDMEDKLYISSLSKEACARDYIYYGITEVFNITEGTLDKEYREYITSIQFNSYNSLTHVNDLENQSPDADWSDGNLEIVFDFIFLTKEAAISTIKKMISVEINKLFDSETKGTKIYYLPNPIEVFNWDLAKFGDTYKIDVSEYDNGTQSQYTASITSVYGSNFKSEAGGSLFGLIKVGANYSYSNTTTKQASTVITSTNNSDPLGGVFVNFFDPIYTNDKVWIVLTFYDYDTGINFTELGFQIDRGKDSLNKLINDLKNRVYDDDVLDYNPTGSTEYYVELSNWTQNSNFYTSNTGMVTLSIEPKRIYQ